MQRDKQIFKWEPLIESSTARKPRTRVVQFGDGYMQRSKDGINHDLRSHTLKFKDTDSVINDIDQFLEDRAGIESFYYSYKGQPLRLYVCEEWSRVDLDFNSSEISAIFKEVVN